MKVMLKKAVCIMLAMAMVLTVAAGVCASEVSAASIKYKTYSNTRFTYQVKYPTIFTKKTDYVSSDGTKLVSEDGKSQATIWNSYGTGKKRTGKTVVATAKKSKKITVVKVAAKECNYFYKSGKNIVQYYYSFISNGEIAIQLTYPSSKKAYFNKAIKTMMKSAKANTVLTLKD